MFNPITSLRIKHHYGRYGIVRKLVSGKGEALLDVGCGSPARCIPPGAFLDFLSYGSGIDIEPLKISAPFKIGSITKIPHGDQSFDVVTAIEVIEHIADPLPAFREVCRVLKPKGLFVMTTPDSTPFFSAFWWCWEKTLGREWHSTHLTTFRKEQWIRLIEQDGHFRIKNVFDYWHVNIIFELEKIGKRR